MSQDLTPSQAAHLESLIDDDMAGSQSQGADPAGHEAFLDDAQQKLTAGNAAVAASANAAVGGVRAAPSVALQPSVGTALASAFSSASVSAPAPSPSLSASTAVSGTAVAASSARASSLSGSDTDEDEPALTPEEQEKHDLVNNINEVIARVKAAGFTFSGKIETAVVAAFLDAKDVFDAANIDITDCANTSRKISKRAVDVKAAELREVIRLETAEAAVEAAVAAGQGGDMSQALDIMLEEEEESDGAESEVSYDTMSKPQLEARKANLTKEIAFSKAKLSRKPRTLAYQELKAAMLAAGAEYGEKYEEHQEEFEKMKKYWFANWMNNQWEPFTVYQMEFFMKMLEAEIETRKLPAFISESEEELTKINNEIQQINFDEFQAKERKREAKLARAAEQDVARRLGGKRSSSGSSSSKKSKVARRK